MNKNKNNSILSKNNNYQNDIDNQYINWNEISKM
jgi:hypothetical protein